MAKRDDRYRGLLKGATLATHHVLIVGCGSIGRQVALTLATMGVGRFTLVDHDTIEEANLGTQGWEYDCLKLHKAVALARDIRSRFPRAQSDPKLERFDVGLTWSPVVFCCVDSMAVRKEVFEWWHVGRPSSQPEGQKCLFVDGRMSAEICRVLSVEPGEEARYESSLFDDGEAFGESCTVRSTFYCANIASGLMVAEWMKWVGGRTNRLHDYVFSIPTGTGVEIDMPEPEPTEVPN